MLMKMIKVSFLCSFLALLTETGVVAVETVSEVSYNNLAISIDIPTGGTVADLAGDAIFKTEVEKAIKSYLTGKGVASSAAVSVSSIAEPARRGRQLQYTLSPMVIDYTVTSTSNTAVDAALADTGFGAAMNTGVDTAVGTSASSAGSIWKTWADAGKMSSVGTVQGASNTKTAAPAPAAAAPAPASSDEEEWKLFGLLTWSQLTMIIGACSVCGTAAILLGVLCGGGAKKKSDEVTPADADVGASPVKDEKKAGSVSEENTAAEP